jgi:mitotic spindle assembly checkpoint protein MAD2
MSTTTSTDTKVITLTGSIQIVSEFFHTAINSILYQRGIYQPETFRRESKYGLTILTTTDEGLLSYLQNVMDQMEVWLKDGNVQRLVVVVTGVDSEETLERWQFNVSVEGDEDGIDGIDGIGGNENKNEMNMDKGSSSTSKSSKIGKKSIVDIHNEIQAIIRQITASVSWGNLIFIGSLCVYIMYISCIYRVSFSRVHHCTVYSKI